MGSRLKKWAGTVTRYFLGSISLYPLSEQVLLSEGQDGLFEAVGVSPNGYKQLEDIIPEWRLVEGNERPELPGRFFRVFH